MAREKRRGLPNLLMMAGRKKKSGDAHHEPTYIMMIDRMKLPVCRLRSRDSSDLVFVPPNGSESALVVVV
jgi:hypothetical protein